jgi:hypothetical protein
MRPRHQSLPQPPTPIRRGTGETYHRVPWYLNLPLCLLSLPMGVPARGQKVHAERSRVSEDGCSALYCRLRIEFAAECPVAGTPQR